jgi:hypothetical protein
MLLQLLLEHSQNLANSLSNLEITSNTTEEFNGGGCWVDNSTSLPGYLVRQLTTSFMNMTGDSMTDKAIYDNATRTVIPIISVFMPRCEQLSRECHGRRVGPNDLPSCLKV